MKQYFRCFFQPLPLFRKCHGLQRNHADARLQRIIFVRSGRNTADNVLARHDEIGSPFRKSLPPFRESSGKNNSREPCHYRRIPECLHYEREKGGKTISLILLPACILAIAATAVPFPVSRFKTEVGVYIGTEYGCSCRTSPPRTKQSASHFLPQKWNPQAARSGLLIGGRPGQDRS